MLVRHCEDCGIELDEDELLHGGQDKNSGECFYWCTKCTDKLRQEADEAYEEEMSQQNWEEEE